MRQMQDAGIVSNMIGGLNLIDTPHNMELTDAPMLVNALPVRGGGVVKRPGTKITWRDNYSRFGVTMTSVTSRKGIPLLVAKESQSIATYFVHDKFTARVNLQSNVFDSEAKYVRANTTVITDDDVKVLFFTGTNKIVHLRVSELEVVGTGTTATFNHAQEFNGLNSSNVTLFKDGEVYLGSYSISYSSGTLSITGLTSVTSARYTVLGFSWQWYAEAQQRYGKNVFNWTTRSNSTAGSDNIVPIPVDLLKDLDYAATMDSILNKEQKPFFLMKCNQLDSSGTCSYTATTTPSAWDSYYFHDGSPFVGNGSAKTNPTPLYVAFGTVEGTNVNAKRVFFGRYHKMPFNAGVGLTPNNLDVYSDGALQMQESPTSSASGLSTFNKYLLYTENQVWAEVPEPGNTTTVVNRILPYIVLGGRFGNHPNAVLELINKQTSHVGSGATQNRYYKTGANKIGAYLPWFGASTYFNFSNRQYPTVGAVHNGRLYLGGLPNTPSRVVVSSLGFSRSQDVGSFFENNEIFSEATDGFDFLLPTQDAGEVIVSMRTWQDALFILTNKGAFRFVGDRNDNRTDAMARIGALNDRAVVMTSLGIYYIGVNGGLYTLTSRDNVANNYDSVSKAEKVLPIFNNVLETKETAWLAYDSINKRLFVGLPDYSLPNFFTHRLYVYSIELENWTEFYTHGHFRIYAAAEHYDKMMFSASTQIGSISSEPSNYMVCRFTDRHFLDWVDTATCSSTSTEIFIAAPFPGVKHTTVNGQLEYATSGNKTGQLSGFDMIPLNSVEDVRVLLNATLLQFNVDYVKLDNGNIYLTANPGAGKTLYAYPKTL